MRVTSSVLLQQCRRSLYVLTQEVFVDQGHAGKIPFLDGQRWSTKVHIRYVMEHEGSRKGNVSAGQMWDFTQSISGNDLGIIRRYKSGSKMSRRMMILCRRMIQKFPHMLQDIPGW